MRKRTSVGRAPSRGTFINERGTSSAEVYSVNAINMKTPSTLLCSLLIVLTVIVPASAGDLIIAYMDEAKIVLVDGKTYQIIATMESGKNPHEVRVSRDNRRAYV